MEKLAVVVGRRIRNYRKNRKLSQESLAELAACHSTYIGQLERGEKNATIESLEKIANALDVPLAQLFDKLDGEVTDEENYPLLCYEFILGKEMKEQQQLFEILKGIDQYKEI